jgi:hypothetical protein
MKMFNRRLRLTLSLKKQEITVLKDLLEQQEKSTEEWMDTAISRREELNSVLRKNTELKNALERDQAELRKYRRLVRDESAADMLLIAMKAVGLITEPVKPKSEQPDYPSLFADAQRNFLLATQHPAVNSLGGIFGGIFS